MRLSTTRSRIGDDAVVDVARLADGRTLVTASPGAGKSYLFRVLAERVAVALPVLVIDPEGEYASLREAVDVVVFGAGHDVPTPVAAAAAIARALANLRTSAVLDLSDLKLAEQQSFVRDFLTAQMSLPKRLQRPRLLLLDEAHLMAPEKTFGESVALGAIRDAMTRGRKRNLGIGLASQRLSMLDKTCAGVAQNVLFGATTLDTDLNRTGRMLGLRKAQQAELRDLEPGQFFAFGPAFTHRGVRLFRVGHARSTHPEPGQRHLIKPPRPSAEIAAALDELRKTAEAAVDGAPAPDAPPDRKASQQAARLREEVSRLQERVASLHRELAAKQKAIRGAVQLLREVPAEQPPKAAPKPSRQAAATATPPDRLNGARVRGSLKHRMLVALAQHKSLGRARLAALAVTKAGHGGCRKALSELRREGYATLDEAGRCCVTDEGARAAGDVPPPPTQREIFERWRRRMGGPSLRGRMFDELVEQKRLTRAQLAAALGSKPGHGGFRKALSELRKAGFAVAPRGGEVRVAPWILEDV